MSEWKKASDPPSEIGYYMTFYLHEEKGYLFKAFSWNGKKWVFQRFDPNVIYYWNVRHDYYVPCEMQKDIGPLPEKYENKK
jgi:hypothetical protein